jgi:hypothetical protein
MGGNIPNAMSAVVRSSVSLEDHRGDTPSSGGSLSPSDHTVLATHSTFPSVTLSAAQAVEPFHQVDVEDLLLFKFSKLLVEVISGTPLPCFASRYVASV